MSFEFPVCRSVAAAIRNTRRLSPAVFLFLAQHAPQVLARTGGGEHFDSGGESSSSSGGGDSVIFDIVFEILWHLIVREPQVGIPLTLAVVGFIYWNRQTTGDVSTRKAIKRADSARRTRISTSAVDGGISDLQARDVGFDLDKFLVRVRREFGEVQDAWFRRDLEPVRRYLSDATFQRLTTQLRLLKALGVRDAVADLKIDDVQIIGVSQNKAFDTLQVRIGARLRDSEAPATASEEEARRVALQQLHESFAEVWTFVRKHDVRSEPDRNANPDNCPSCGAPFDGGATNTCRYCGAIVNSGHYDWVLAEITQGSQYQPVSAQPPGLAQQRKLDPALSTEVLEDRASLIFWKWVEAQSCADASRLAKLASPAFVERVHGELAQLVSQGKRKYFIECAVGAVDTLQFAEDGEHTVAAVNIRWSARMAVGAPGERPVSAPVQRLRHVLLLERRTGAQTGSTGMATNRCPSCAASLSDNGQPSCEFCGTLLSGGDADWVLRDFCTWECWQAQDREALSGSLTVREVPDRAERERLLYLMLASAKADGIVDQNEAAMLRMAAGRWGIAWAEFEAAINAADDALPAAIAKGSAEAEGFLHDVSRLMLADGKIDAKEKKLLKVLALHLGLYKRLGEFLK